MLRQQSDNAFLNVLTTDLAMGEKDVGKNHLHSVLNWSVICIGYSVSSYLRFDIFLLIVCIIEHDFAVLCCLY